MPNYDLSRPMLFTIDNGVDRYTAVQLLKANAHDPQLADLLARMIDRPVGAFVVYGGGAQAEFRITKVGY